MNNPLVSIIIPVYNRADLISQSLESVLDQTYENWECIVIDDGSTDGTLDVVKKYATRDARFSSIKRPTGKPKGAAACRNVGLEHSSGNFIQYLDSDDLLHPEKLEKQMKYARRDVVLTGKWGYFSGEDLMERFKYKQNCYRNFRDPLKLLFCFGKHDEFLPLHCYLIPRNIIEKSGKWKEDLGNNDDAEYMSRILLNTPRVKFDAEAIVFYRVEGKSTLSGFKTVENAESAVKSLRYLENILSNYPKISSLYLGNLKNKIKERIKDSFPDLYIKNNDLWF
ncbi:glycosyl transferase family 2 [Christiangramia fulva]|uniref:Glycosyl transferase family 2 n=1 Tax=Christiangramia fulva TaxID=2126553 RepID=A0A2R3Z0P5_9FLAO|nr:glycosyltransferase family 2 protein [Christiangramia fulva]AVR43841.1 glycosyl transferase family 2 [Christiangramia fulva]